MIKLIMNKYHRIIFLILFLYSCKDDIIIKPNPCDCLLPIRLPDGYYIPKFNGWQELSPDGTRILYNSGYNYILDLKSGSETTIDLNDYLDGDREAIYQRVHWCPYDNNKVLFECGLLNDSSDGGKTFYKVDLIKRTAEKLMPAAFDTIYSQRYAEGIYFGGWLYGSTNEYDSILARWTLWDGLSTNHIVIDHDSIYMPQEKKFAKSNYRKLMRQSHDGRMYFSIDSWSGAHPREFILNREHILFDDVPVDMEYASWSPNNQLLALTVVPLKPNNECDTTERFEEVWIIDVKAYYEERPYLMPVKIINFQKSFCTYNFVGVYAEFITDSTLAVSMHKDGDTVSNLWEITIDGKLVRQLTFH